MNLESRASRAVRSLKASIAGLAAPTGAMDPARRHRRRIVGAVALGTAAAAALLVTAALVLPIGTSPGQTLADGSPGPTTVLPDGSNLDGRSTLPFEEGSTSQAGAEAAGDTGGSSAATIPVDRGDAGLPGTLPVTSTTSGGGGASESQGNQNGAPGDYKDPAESDDSDIMPRFWAAQAYGCSAEEEPSELFYGGGEPGETIALDSPYGSAEAVVGEDGYWEAGITFSGAVYGEVFAVTATTSAGEAVDLSFVATDPADGPCQPPVEYWFSAYQAYGCSAEEPPSELFYGSGSPGETITLDSLYGSGTALVDESGWWETTITFEGAPVDEPFLVTATSAAGEVWELSFTAAADEESCIPPMEYWFSAYQASGCSMETPPLEWFYGTGIPGDTIAITSPYGSASAVVDEWGWWEAQITFTDAPYEEPFAIDVTAPNGEGWSFSFTVPDPETGSCFIFTAYQGAGCSTAEEPSEYFWGTGTPGDEVAITSPYGSASAVVDEWGYWEATVTFVGAPVGEAFTIEVAGPDGEVWAFTFMVADADDGTCWVEPPCTPDGCGVEPAPYPLPGGEASPAYIESVELVIAESYPAQVSVLVAGDLPTPCHKLAWDLSVPDDAGYIYLDVYSLADSGGACADVLDPFEETIAIGDLADGDYILVVNGVEYPFTV